MTCDKATELLSEYLDGCLEWHKSIELENHINLCSDCSNELTELVKLTNKLKTLPEMELPANFHKDLMEKCKVHKKRKFIFTGWKMPATFAAIFLTFIVLISLYNIIPINKSYELSSPGYLDNDIYDSASQSSDMGAIIVENSVSEIAPAESPAMGETEPYLTEKSFELAEERGFYDDVAVEQSLANDVDYSSSKVNDSVNTSSTSQKIIKRSSFSINVENFDDAAGRINEITINSGGYVENSSSYINQSYLYNSVETTETKNGFLILKIPAEKYEHVKSLMFELGKITDQNESAEDITLRYVDNEARLSVKKAEESRLLSLMENADKIEDLILLEQRLASVRSEIESFEQQLKSWDNLTQFSTIEVNLSENEKYELKRSTETSFLAQIQEGISYSLISTYGKFQYLLILTARNIIPIFFIIIVIFVIAAVFIIKRRNSKK